MTDKKTLSVDDKLGILAREYSARAEPFEGGKGLPVGCSGIEMRWMEGAVLTIRDSLREGLNIEDATKKAKITVREYIKKHNRKRPKDINWERWEGAADYAIERARKIVV